MSYFNHAFQKVFIGTAGINQTGSTNALTASQYGLYNAKTFANYTTAMANAKQSFILAAGSNYANDKNGPYHGGYKESNKSKEINPKYINGFYKVEDRAATASTTIVGRTNTTIAAACAPKVVCGETYRLRIDIKGSPALRFLSHQLYKTIDAYTGCCIAPVAPAAAVTAVDPVTVMIQWAKAIKIDPFLSQFIQPTVRYRLTSAGAFLTLTEAQWETYTAQTTTLAISTIETGIELLGSYFDTVFNTCSFEPTDHFEKEPIQIYASFVDELGDPCLFTSMCVDRTALGVQGEGYGETILRELILSESYGQNYFNSDPRIREITQGDSVFGLNKALLYTTYYILHSVPRFNNPSGTFDNDQYLLKLVVPSGNTATQLELLIGQALTAANNPVSLVTYN